MAPVDPPPRQWSMVPPPDDHPDDLWAVGADLEPGTLLAAYRLGLFPMPVGTRLGWFSPLRRGASCRRLDSGPRARWRRAARRYEIRIDTSFETVVAGCARPGDPTSWIDARITRAYARLHALGWAHSVEAWDDEGPRVGCTARRDRRALRRRVDVPRPQRRVEGRIPRSRGAPPQRG